MPLSTGRPSPGREVCDFQIDIVPVGAKTVVLNCLERRTREPPTGKTYGFAFEAWGMLSLDVQAWVTTGPSHMCVVLACMHIDVLNVYWGEQDMLNIKLIVCFEVDACLPTDNTSRPPVILILLSPTLIRLALPHQYTPSSTLSLRSTAPSSYCACFINS